MLQSKKNKITISILDKLMQKGMPESTSVPPTMEFDEEPEYEDLDPAGETVAASDPLLSRRTAKKRPKKIVASSEY